MSDPDKELLWQAYLAGFKASAEGWNGEFPWYIDEKRDDMKQELRHGVDGFEQWFNQMHSEGEENE